MNLIKFKLNIRFGLALHFLIPINGWFYKPVIILRGTHYSMKTKKKYHILKQWEFNSLSSPIYYCDIIVMENNL